MFHYYYDAWLERLLKDETSMLKKTLSRVLRKAYRISVVLGLRAKYYRSPIDLKIFLRDSNDKESQCISALDVGSGPKPRNPFGAHSVYGVDIRSFDVNPNVKKCILGKESIPFEDNLFNAITAYDVLEHIPRVANEKNMVVFPFVMLMNEIWRVMKVGGLFYSETPCFPMKEAFQDPTHVNIMTEDTLRLYFSESAWARIYGFVGSFSLVAEGWRGSHYFCVLQKTTETPLLKLNEPQK